MPSPDIQPSGRCSARRLGGWATAAPSGGLLTCLPTRRSQRDAALPDRGDSGSEPPRRSDAASAVARVRLRPYPTRRLLRRRRLPSQQLLLGSRPARAHSPASTSTNEHRIREAGGGNHLISAPACNRAPTGNCQCLVGAPSSSSAHAAGFRVSTRRLNQGLQGAFGAFGLYFLHHDRLERTCFASKGRF